MADTLPVDKLESLLELVNEFGRTSEEVGRADMHVGYDPGRHYKNEECDDAKKQLVEAITRLCSSATARDEAFASIRVFAQDCIENSHDRGHLGNLYSIRDLCDSKGETK